MELDKGTWEVALVTSQVDLSSSPLTPLQMTWQETACQVKTCHVNLKGDPLKSHLQDVPRTPPKGYWGEGSGHGHGQKKGQNPSLFYFFRWKWCSWNYFAMFYTTRGCIATWQSCCGVGGISATVTICRQYVRWDMPLTINCVLLPLHFHVLLTLLPLWADRGFVCKKCLWVYSFRDQ